MQTMTIKLATPQALVMELGRIEVTSAWWMRAENGVQGLEAFTSPDTMVRLELVDEPDNPRVT